MKFSFALLFLALVSSSFAKVYFKETFDNNWQKRWVPSKHKSDYGEFKLSHGKFYGDAEKDLGIQTSQDARFYAISAKANEKFSNKGKDLVLQFSVKHEQNIDCGGGYIKLLPSFEPETFNGDTQYAIMFGPDICGSTKRTHVIFNYKGENHLIEKTIQPQSDVSTHVYTLVVHPDQTYDVLIDQKSVQTGKIDEDFPKMLGPKKIKDPEAKKPSDWDDRPKIDDPTDTKPADWDTEPEFIDDPEAVKPADWDDDMDGDWEAPKISNPEYKGEWRAKQIENPNYKGAWVHPEIDNPDYKYDDSLYAFDNLEHVGFDLWQVKSGTIFDNIIVTDSLQEAQDFYKETTGSTIEGEKKMKEAADEEERKKAEEEAKLREAEKAAEQEDEDDFDDDEDDDDFKDEL